MKQHEHPLVPLADLHTHVGGAVDAAILWTLAHEQGIKLPTKDYWEFERLVTVQKTGKGGVLALDREKYHWTELIQSSPLAMEPAVHETLGGAYRANHVVLHEIRYNPMKRNRGGERDLDHIILATIRGMEEALLEYPEIRAGFILIFDREFTYRMNEIIYEKACKYQSRGIIGIDVAGPQAKTFRMEEYKDLFLDAKQRGFGVTIHTGEEGDLKEMRYVVDHIEPQRIGHGFMAHKDKKLMALLKEKRIALELCPTSNLNIGTIKNITEMKRIYRTLYDAGALLTINTDGPEMHGTNLWKEFNLLKDAGIFSESEVKKLIQNAFNVTFIH
ncbi:adenosine deaminase [Candidatus Uhrbacteria bacterium]|nr:adenosine deaminase [Candidatus Uhrbacteria bacterium]